jgi:hypothetical protein
MPEPATLSACHLAAREYLARGLHPIPCAPRTKRPLAKWEPYQTEAPLLDEVDVWWEEVPDANVALLLGRGTFAVDLDGGAAAEQLLAAHGITLPAGAPRSRTAKGAHVFLAADGPVPDRVALLRAQDGSAQVDIRARGIVVAPPSIHPTGARYEWVVPLTLPLPPAPPALLALIRGGRAEAVAGLVHPAPTSGVGTRWILEALAGTPEGQRDATCTRLAGYLLGKGLDAETVTALLAESFARRCTPPFPAGEVRKCVESIARREGSHGALAERPIVPEPLHVVLDRWEPERQVGPPRMVPTPFPTLSQHLAGGFAPGELVYLGARPAVGKTALGLECTRAAARAGHGVLVVSREMVTTALARRLIAQDARVDALALRTHRLAPGEQGRVRDARRRLGALPIWLTDAAVSLDEITACIAGWREPPLGLVLIDYLQLIRAPAGIRERRLQVEAVSQGLKTLAVEARLPIVCLSSLSRPAEGRDRKPTLSSLRESGELEHDADVVLLLHREFDAREAVCEVAKNRDGRVGPVSLVFRAEWVAFDEASDRAEAVGGWGATGGC